MSSIVWLASYPKSGSTWIRILLSNYLRDADEPADINALGGRLGHAAARVLFDEWVGVDDISVAEVMSTVQRRIAARG